MDPIGYYVVLALTHAKQRQAASRTTTSAASGAARSGASNSSPGTPPATVSKSSQATPPGPRASRGAQEGEAGSGLKICGSVLSWQFELGAPTMTVEALEVGAHHAAPVATAQPDEKGAFTMEVPSHVGARLRARQATLFFHVMDAHGLLLADTQGTCHWDPKNAAQPVQIQLPS